MFPIKKNVYPENLPRKICPWKHSLLIILDVEFTAISINYNKIFLLSTNFRPDEAPIVIAGTVTKGDKDFSPQAAKVAHDKPQPTREKPPNKGAHNQPQMNLKQPGKHWNTCWDQNISIIKCFVFFCLFIWGLITGFSYFYPHTLIALCTSLYIFKGFGISSFNFEVIWYKFRVSIHFYYCGVILFISISWISLCNRANRDTRKKCYQ